MDEKKVQVVTVDDGTTLNSPPPPMMPPPRYQRTDTDKIIEVILLICLPPLAVWYHDRACSGSVCLNICLTFMFIIPGLIHAFWYCFIKDHH